ncbi:manganese and iron superoxide dismutase [Cystobasidium minutum MCA 4210]|uniref:mitochondrial 37S ribosomal protein mS42 n=1 Tax=Cystobasidium minutum MCA 4210 TaxID=1397322 RepID=UPI0034D004D4|eukprot:jgi/Rhomi1/144213/e_gw1.4.430.1
MASTSSTSRLLSSCTCAVRRSAFRIQRSQIHTAPRLPYDIESGLPPFLSSKAVKGTAIEWQQGNLNKLNDLIRGTKHENKSVAQTVIDAAKSPSDALIFGHASEALNNGYFLSCLTPSQDQEKSLENSPIKQALENNFGSATSFINHFSSYAMGMFGTGYVWLVMDGVDNLAVVGTYGSGTMLVQGSVQPAKAAELNALAGSVDAAPSNEQPAAPSASGSSTGSLGAALNKARGRSYSTSSVLQALAFPERHARENEERFKSIHPLLCLSLHPHVYIPDYGIWGKEEYIRNFWGNVNWELCYRRYQKVQELRPIRKY